MLLYRAASVVFWIALCLWFSLAVVGGLAAMAIFPAARELPISMQGYEAFLAAEPVMGRQLVAGYLVERVFEVALQPRYVLAAITVAAFVTQLIVAHREKCDEPLRRTRIAALTCAVAALVVGSVLLVGFRAADQKYRALAGTEKLIGEAIATKPFVDAAHENASRAATAEVFALLALAGLTAAAAASTAGGRRA
jgi:sugar phosphate permease